MGIESYSTTMGDYIRCHKCGMYVLYGQSHSCQIEQDVYKLPTVYGWICPVCNKVNAPFIMSCDHKK